MEHLQAKSSQVRLDWTFNLTSNTQPEVIHRHWSIDRSSNAPSASNGLLASRESWQQSLKKAGGRRQMAGGGQLKEDSNLSQLHFSLKGEACTKLGGREEENLLPPAPCPLPSKAFALVKPIQASFSNTSK